MSEPGALVTFGHGRLDGAELVALLESAGVEHVVDVRRFPGSRSNPAAARDQIPAALQPAGISYRWAERLGGRRSLSAQQDAASPDGWWRVKAFRAYAAWTRTEDFRAGLGELLEDLHAHRTAIMCSESVWWRCHRRIIADVVLGEHRNPVVHLMHDGRLLNHELSEGLRLDGDDHAVWNGS